LRRTAAGTATALAISGCAGVAPPPATPVSAVPPSTYVCGDGRRIEVARDPATGVAILTDGAQKITAFETVGEGPSRFVAGEVTIDAFENHLQVTGGRLRTFACPRRPDAPEAGVLAGTLSKRDRMALPPGTRARVVLADVSKADAPAAEIAAAEIETSGNQVPLHFLLRFPPDALVAGRRYAVAARVTDANGALRYITDTRVEIASSSPAPVDLQLARTPGGG
jgi:putative lipoprotein